MVLGVRAGDRVAEEEAQRLARGSRLIGRDAFVAQPDGSAIGSVTTNRTNPARRRALVAAILSALVAIGDPR